MENTIPEAEEAELVLAAIATVFPGWTDYAVTIDDVYSPPVRRIARLVGDPRLIAARPGEDESPTSARVRVMARLASVDARWLTGVAEEYACLGRRHALATEITDAARRRRLMAAAREIYAGAASLDADELAAVVAEMADLVGAS